MQKSASGEKRTGASKSDVSNLRFGKIKPQGRTSSLWAFRSGKRSEADMPTYRFCIHAADEHLVGDEQCSHATDEAAVRFAQILLSKGPAVVVWRGDRLIKRVTRPGRNDIDL